MKDGYHGEVSDPPPGHIPVQLCLPVSDAPFSIQTCICCPRTVQAQFLHAVQIQIKGVFSSPFHPKVFGFWLIILQNGTKHHAKILTKRYSFSILDFGLKRKKKPKNPHIPIKILAFWMELNTKKLAFCISSFQSS